MPRFIKIWLFSALLSLMAIGMWKAIECYYSKEMEEVPPIKISALDLAKSYEKDSTLSSLTYSGEDVILTGIVISIRQTGNHYTLALDGNVYDIDLIFSDMDEINKIKTINNGDTITVKGEVSGFNLLSIQVIDCYFE